VRDRLAAGLAFEYAAVCHHVLHVSSPREFGRGLRTLTRETSAGIAW